MNISSRGLALIKKHEGLRLRAYRDAVNVWTIGYGHTSMAGHPYVNPGMKITRAEANNILANDISMFSVGMMKMIKVSLTQGQYDALLSLSFNIGLGNFSGSTLLKKLNAGDYMGAAYEFPKWRKAKGRVYAGLVKRRAVEKALFLSDVSVDGPYDREIEVDTGKPIKKSTTAWTAIFGAIMNGVTAVVGLGEKQPLLAGFIVVVGVGFAFYIVHERKRLAREGMV